MEKKLLALKEKSVKEVQGTKDAKALETVRIRIFGSNGTLTHAMKELPKLPKAKRPKVGKLINEIKQELQHAIAEKQQKLQQKRKVSVDITVPGIQPNIGHLHPITKAIWDIGDIFKRIGFEVTDTREIETDWYAFGALNFPVNHPARDEWETFFLETNNLKLNTDDKIVLTPHTSSAQVRVMEKEKPPIRNITISKCYRRQADVSHLQMFHQFEGIFVDTNVSIANLKGTLDYFVMQYFGRDRVTRIRPYDFRFTEPSFEVDVTCANCNGRGCRLCKQGWLELGGAGMIHPNVLHNGGLDPEIFSGFAFGWGVERVWMMKSGIKLPDIRQIYSGDLRFNQQF